MIDWLIRSCCTAWGLGLRDHIYIFLLVVSTINDVALDDSEPSVSIDQPKKTRISSRSTRTLNSWWCYVYPCLIWWSWSGSGVLVHWTTWVPLNRMQTTVLSQLSWQEWQRKRWERQCGTRLQPYCTDSAKQSSTTGLAAQCSRCLMRCCSSILLCMSLCDYVPWW